VQTLEAQTEPTSIHGRTRRMKSSLSDSGTSLSLSSLEAAAATVTSVSDLEPSSVAASKGKKKHKKAEGCSFH